MTFGSRRRLGYTFLGAGAVCLIVICFLWVKSGAVATERQQRPNVLIILLDAVRADHVGFYGYNRPTTPEIDRICANSLVFTQAFSVAPYTLASVASLFTSLYPQTHGVLDRGLRLSEKTPTMAESFRNAGYQTILAATTPFLSPEFRLNRAFEVQPKKYFIIHQPNRAQLLTGDLLAQLNGARSPFFCYVHYLFPHEPYNAPEEFREIFGRRGKFWNHDFAGIEQGKIPLTPALKADIVADYDAGLRAVDREVGRVFQYLRNRGWLDNTIVVILSDHGEAFGEHGMMRHNSTLYDEMIQIPLIFHFPRKLKPRKDVNLAQTVDIFPTLTDLTNAPEPDFVQGESLLSNQREYAFMQTNGRTAAIFAVRTLQAKMIRDPAGKGTVFYDLKKDRLEKRPLGRDQVSGRDAAQFNALEPVFARWLSADLAKGPGAEKLNNLDPALLEKLKSLGYIR